MTLDENEKPNPRTPDEHDRASDLEAMFTADAINTARKAARPQQVPDENGVFAITECVECGEDIGIERLRVAIKNLNCIDCARLAERGVR